MRTLFVLLLLISTGLHAQGLRDLPQSAFQRGESLQYKAYYGLINAARATLEIAPANKIVSKRNTYHVVGTGKSLGAFSWFFKVDDRYETYIDEKAIAPWQFHRRVQEGGYKLERDIYFNQFKHELRVKELKNNSEKTYATQPHIQDLLSSFYYARTLPLEKAQPGDEFTILTFFDGEHYPMKIRFLGRENIKIGLGTFACLKFRPLLQEGRVFKESEDMTIWLSDDSNKIPIRLQTNLLIGSLKMDLESYGGLVAKLNKLK